MKNNVLKYYVTAFYLCATFVMFAQPGEGNGGTGDAALEGADAPAAAIDNYVWVLALVGLMFVFIKFKVIHKNKIQG